MKTDKWGVAVQNLAKIIEKNEQKLSYFQNRLKQAQFIDRPNQRMLRAAGVQADLIGDQLSGMRRQLRELERLHSGGIRLRTTEECNLRRVWDWIHGPAMRKIMQSPPSTFQTFSDNWRHWLADEDMNPLSIELGTGELIGFMLIKRATERAEHSRALLEFIVIRPDYRFRAYGTDAVREVIIFAFEQLKVEVLMLQVDPDNEPALQCFEKGGLRYLDVELLDNDETSVDVDSRTMGIYRQQWQRETLSAATYTGEQTSNIPSPRLSPHLSAKLLAPLKDLIQNN